MPANQERDFSAGFGRVAMTFDILVGLTSSLPATSSQTSIPHAVILSLCESNMPLQSVMLDNA